jgi:hypothetical protein
MTNVHFDGPTGGRVEDAGLSGMATEAGEGSATASTVAPRASTLTQRRRMATTVEPTR